MMAITNANFTLEGTNFSVTIDQSLILIAANDNPFANYSVWNSEIQKAALIALGDVNKHPSLAIFKDISKKTRPILIYTSTLGSIKAEVNKLSKWDTGLSNEYFVVFYIDGNETGDCHFHDSITSAINDAKESLKMMK